MASDLDYLLQKDITDRLMPSIGREAELCVYQLSSQSGYRSPGIYRHGVLCALLDDKAATEAIGRNEDDCEFKNGGKARPLVLLRSFHGAFEEYVEISEEFRLYHNLAEDKEKGQFFTFDTSGNKIEVVRIIDSRVIVQLKYIRQFQAENNLHLAIYIYSWRKSPILISNIPQEEIDVHNSNKNIRWKRDIRELDYDGYNSCSSLFAKIILSPGPMLKPKEIEVSFIIGINSDGEDIEHSSDPSKLANSFGKNPGAPPDITPVYFRREVLKKYYDNPSRYKIEDGLLSCLSLWDCRIDNDNEDIVIVLLCYLGECLPYEERLHWRQFNIAFGRITSQTGFRRNILGEFTDPQSPDLIFPQIYTRLTKSWKVCCGWDLFLPPDDKDKHLLATIHLPLTGEQKEIDEQILNITKLLVDSLNEKEIAAGAGELKENPKGIDKLESFLKRSHPNFLKTAELIKFLRNLQSLRSSGSAHRKGKNYKEILSKSPQASNIESILKDAIALLGALEQYIQNHQQNQSPPP